MKINHLSDRRMYPTEGNVSFVMALLTLAQVQASMPDKLIGVQSDHWLENEHRSKVLLAKDLPADPSKPYRVRYITSTELHECPATELSLTPSLFVSRWRFVEVA